jgi:hypothetical protein
MDLKERREKREERRKKEKTPLSLKHHEFH